MAEAIYDCTFLILCYALGDCLLNKASTNVFGCLLHHRNIFYSNRLFIATPPAAVTTSSVSYDELIIER